MIPPFIKHHLCRESSSWRKTRSLLLADKVSEKWCQAKTWHYLLILGGGVLQLWRALTVILALFFFFSPFFLAVRLFVKCVHQLESVAIRLTWCERIRESICWHSGQRYVINADFTLHWIELAMIATSPPLIHPIKPSLFIYLQPQQPDMHGMSATRSLTHAHKKRNCAHFICGGQGHARRYLT